MRGLGPATLTLAACLPACFMSGYETPRSDAGALTDGAGGGGLQDAVAVDATSGEPVDAEICRAVDAGAPTPLCDGGSCTLATAFCAEACERPWCDPCNPCRLFCNDPGCESNCLRGRYCRQECEDVGCASICKTGARCDVQCHDAESCRVVCEPGSNCSVDCLESNRCAVTCMPGASCELRCARPGEGCGFTECSGTRSQCGGSELCGGFGCSPP